METSDETPKREVLTLQSVSRDELAPMSKALLPTLEPLIARMEDLNLQPLGELFLSGFAEFWTVSRESGDCCAVLASVVEPVDGVMIARLVGTGIDGKSDWLSVMPLFFDAMKLRGVRKIFLNDATGEMGGVSGAQFLRQIYKVDISHG